MHEDQTGRQPKLLQVLRHSALYIQALARAMNIDVNHVNTIKRTNKRAGVGIVMTAEITDNDIKGYDVVLCDSDSFRHLHVCDICLRLGVRRPGRRHLRHQLAKGHAVQPVLGGQPAPLLRTSP